jgi:hypothetical protein
VAGVAAAWVGLEADRSRNSAARPHLLRS